MALSWDLMKDVVRGGGNLIIHDTGNTSWDILRELAHIAKVSGSHITVSDSKVSWDIARELVAIAGNKITIECGHQKE